MRGRLFSRADKDRDVTHVSFMAGQGQRIFLNSFETPASPAHRKNVIVMKEYVQGMLRSFDTNQATLTTETQHNNNKKMSFLDNFSASGKTTVSPLPKYRMVLYNFWNRWINFFSIFNRTINLDLTLSIAEENYFSQH